MVTAQLVGCRTVQFSAEPTELGQSAVNQQFDHQQVLIDGGTQDRAQAVMGAELPVHVFAQALELGTQGIGLEVEGEPLVVGAVHGGQLCAARVQKLLLEAGWPLDGIEAADRLLQHNQPVRESLDALLVLRLRHPM